MTPPAMKATQWQICEIAFQGKAAYENPYRHVELTVAFAGPDGRTIHRPAFWDGGETWRVRFAPTAPGAWRWRSLCSNTEDAGMHDRSGQIDCRPYEGDNSIYRHGFLRVSDNGRHFVHADGTPFFWLGDTHWMMPDTEQLEVCNHPSHAGGRCPHGGQFQHVAAARRAGGFSVYQMYPNVSMPHWWGEPYTRIDPERFRAVFDRQMDHLAAGGFVIAMGLGHFNASTLIPQVDLCRWARYIVARYGAHPAVWITCQEMNAPEQMRDKESNRTEVWKAVAAEMSRCDGYKHPHSAHQWVLDVDVRPLGQEPWHTWFALQGGHRGSGLTPQGRYKGYYDYKHTRPILETEAMYERINCGGVNTTDDARQSAWKAMLCGSPGYTYGAGGIWALKWDEQDLRLKEYNYPIGSWHEGLALPGAAQMTILRDFFTGLDWPALVPRFDDPAWSQWNDGERCALSTISNRLYLAYCYGETSKGVLKNLDPAAAYSASWFDPRTTDTVAIAEGFRTHDGCWDVPEKPAGDWVLRVSLS